MPFSARRLLHHYWCSSSVEFVRFCFVVLCFFWVVFHSEKLMSLVLAAVWMERYWQRLWAHINRARRCCVVGIGSVLCAFVCSDRADLTCHHRITLHSFKMFISGLCLHTSHPCLQIRLPLTGSHKYCSKTLAISLSRSAHSINHCSSEDFLIYACSNI